jgi:hypothetical protein
MKTQNTYKSIFCIYLLRLFLLRNVRRAGCSNGNIRLCETTLTLHDARHHTAADNRSTYLNQTETQS